MATIAQQPKDDDNGVYGRIRSANPQIVIDQVQAAEPEEDLDTSTFGETVDSESAPVADSPNEFGGYVEPDKIYAQQQQDGSKWRVGFYGCTFDNGRCCLKLIVPAPACHVKGNACKVWVKAVYPNGNGSTSECAKIFDVGDNGKSIILMDIGTVNPDELIDLTVIFAQGEDIHFNEGNEGSAYLDATLNIKSYFDKELIENTNTVPGALPTMVTESKAEPVEVEPVKAEEVPATPKPVEKTIDMAFDVIESLKGVSTLGNCRGMVEANCDIIDNLMSELYANTIQNSLHAVRESYKNGDKITSIPAITTANMGALAGVYITVKEIEKGYEEILEKTEAVRNALSLIVKESSV